MTSQIPIKAIKSGSTATALAEFAPGDTIPSSYLTADNSAGSYALRPAATSVTAGYIYYATDVHEAYRSDGSAWSVLPSCSSELGYAEMTTSFSTASTAPVDVTGLTVTCMVGERAVVMAYGGAIRNNTTGGFAVLRAVANGVVQSNITVPGTGNYITQSRETRISGLTAGTTYIFKLTLMSVTSGTSDVYSDANDRAYLQVRSV
jgi:hypothetical protein